MTRRARWAAAVGCLAHPVVLGLPGVIAHPRGMTNPAVLAFLTLMAAWVCVESRAVGSHRPSPAPDAGPAAFPVMAAGAILLTFWISIIDASGRDLVRLGPAAAGAALVVGGMALRTAAIRTLGGWFLDPIAVVSGQPLVTTGIYAAIRHPSELGNMLLAVGGAVMLGSPSGLAVAVASVVPLAVVRSHLEDRVLARANPVGHAGYAARVPALIPRHWPTSLR